MLRKLKYRYIVMFIMRMYQYIGASKQPGSIKTPRWDFGYLRYAKRTEQLVVINAILKQ